MPMLGAAVGDEIVLLALHRGVGMGLVAAIEMRAARTLLRLRAHPCQIGVARRAGPFADAVGDLFDTGVEWHGTPLAGVAETMPR